MGVIKFIFQLHKVVDLCFSCTAEGGLEAGLGCDEGVSGRRRARLRSALVPL